MSSIDERSYWDKAAQDLAAGVTEAKRYASSPEGKLAAAQSKLDAMRFAHVEDGMYTDAEIAAQQQVVDSMAGEIKAEADAKFAAEWTLEVTQQRRQEWNALVRSGALSRPGKPNMIDPAKVRNQEQRQGWTVDSAKAAAKLHNI